MQVLILNSFSNPYMLIVVGLSLAAAFSFIVFLRGFLSGLKHLTTINENAEELEHMRTRAIWGVVLMASFFGLWEGVRLIIAFMQGTTVPHAKWIIAWVVLDLIFLVWELFFGAKEGAHH